MKPVRDIESPNGIDLNPEPPSTVRLSKLAGMLALFVVFVVSGLIGYGIYMRGQVQFQPGFRLDETKGMTAATDAGKLVSSKVPNRPTLPAAPTELVPSEPILQNPTMTPGSAVYYPQPLPPLPTTNPPREPSYFERQLMAAFEREQEAMQSTTSPRGGMQGAGNALGRTNLPTAEGDIAQMADLLKTMQGPSGQAKPEAILPKISIGSSQEDGEEFEKQNMQAQKLEFLRAARKAEKNNYLGSIRTLPLSPFEIKAGWDIPAVLEQALNSDLPGDIKALVRENVYDSATGRYLLIPQGSRLTGAYDSRISFGQEGLQVVWQRLHFPDGSSINLEGMAGQDAKGYAGFRHDVDHHYRRLLGFGLLTSLFSASFQLSQSRRGGLLGYPSAGEIAGSAVGREMSQLGADIARRNLNAQPTIKVPIGYRFNVRVNRDIAFESPYRPIGP